MSNRIVELIKEKNKTQTEIANELKIHKANLNYKISPNNNPKLNTLINLAKVLDIDYKKIFD